jgi:hypothetical protein
MKFSHFIHQRSFPRNGKYFVQALLEVGEQTEDTVILDCGLE